MPKNKKFMLDPNETAMENLWRCAHATTGFVLKRWWRRLRLTNEERHDIFVDLMTRTVVRFLRKVRRGGYDRRFDFWQNVFSSCWGCSQCVIQVHIRQIRKKLAERSIYEPVGETGVSYLDTMEDTGTPVLNYLPNGYVPGSRKSAAEYRRELATATGKRAENIRRRMREAEEREAGERRERDREFRVALGLEEP